MQHSSAYENIRKDNYKKYKKLFCSFQHSHDNKNHIKTQDYQWYNLWSNVPIYPNEHERLTTVIFNSIQLATSDRFFY